MSDAALRAARAVWERDRPRLWASVERLKDAEYESAFEEYLAAKAQADAVTVEARRRGIRKRRPRPAVRSRPTIPTDFNYAISASGPAVIGVADGAVRYPERERRALREELRQEVRAVRIAPGQAKSNSSSVLCAGKRAALMRASPPWASRAEASVPSRASAKRS